jgi:hypothetical protein
MLCAVLVVSGSALPVQAGDREQKADPFVRLQKDRDQQPVALETAVVHFQSPGRSPAVAVDLIGAIHIGDQAYYEDLNRRFRGYEAVLYELVAREEANVPRPGSPPGSAISGVQVGLKSMLGLAFQLDHIDYAAKNMVHADMSPEEFAASMKNRNESFLGIVFRVMGRGFADQAKDPLGKSDWRLLGALFAEDRAHQLKVAMAEQFADADNGLDMFDGPEGSTLVTERNKKALAVLAREIRKGKKRIAIFYGAAHLADFERRLEQDFGLKRGATDWVVAWSLLQKGGKPTDGPPRAAKP